MSHYRLFRSPRSEPLPGRIEDECNGKNLGYVCAGMEVSSPSDRIIRSSHGVRTHTLTKAMPQHQGIKIRKLSSSLLERKLNPVILNIKAVAEIDAMPN